MAGFRGGEATSECTAQGVAKRTGNINGRPIPIRPQKRNHSIQNGRSELARGPEHVRRQIGTFAVTSKFRPFMTSHEPEEHPLLPDLQTPMVTAVRNFSCMRVELACLPVCLGRGRICSRLWADRTYGGTISGIECDQWERPWTNLNNATSAVENVDAPLSLLRAQAQVRTTVDHEIGSGGLGLVVILPSVVRT